jgi:hypothetical protein
MTALAKAEAPARERPILFSAPMVRALLSGRKTQTRRVAKARKEGDITWRTNPICPYGQPGDVLWVKETWRPCSTGGAWYRATRLGDDPGPWRPSIYMPRWASRITLRLTSVRVERLQAISEEDANAEGVDELDGWMDEARLVAASVRLRAPMEDARTWFAALWESIHGEFAWDANPWVWVLGFKAEVRG